MSVVIFVITVMVFVLSFNYNFLSLISIVVDYSNYQLLLQSI